MIARSTDTLAVDLRAQFGDRYRIRWEGAGVTRGAWQAADRLWLFELCCIYGMMYPVGGGILAAWTDRPRIGARLRRLPFIVTARGDLEVVATFHASDAEAVFAVLKPRRRRRLSPVQRSRNAATLARARQKRLQLLTQSDFPAPESTRDTRNSLRHHRQPENCSAAAEVRPSQELRTRPRSRQPASAR